MGLEINIVLTHDNMILQYLMGAYTERTEGDPGGVIVADNHVSVPEHH